MISLKNCSPSWIVLSYDADWLGCFVSRQNWVRSATYELMLASRALSVVISGKNRYPQ